MLGQEQKQEVFSNRLAGKVAIITGGGHGIGKAYAKRLAQEGAKVVIAEINPKAAQEAAEDLTRENLAVIGIPTDVSSAESLQALVEQVMSEFGRIDVLINNAAIFATIPISRVPFDEIDPAEWDMVMNVNLKGTWLACKAVVPVMRQQGSGKIINITSTSVFQGDGGRVHYVASKAGVIGFTKTLARELGESNITVNCVAPGSTLSEENPSQEVIEYRKKKTDSRALKRIQAPSDLVGTIAFLASADSDFMTGQTLVVDGGKFML